MERFVRALFAAVAVMAAAAGTVCAGAGTAGSPDAVFARGNAAYTAGRFDEAVREYELLQSAGYSGAHLNYNLGNAYFRSQDTGRAVLNYERALLYAPRDADIVSNYSFVRARGSLPEPSFSGPRFFARLDRLGARIGANALAGLLSGSVVLLFAACAVWHFARRERTRSALSVVCVFSLAMFVCAGGMLSLRGRYIARAAVVLRDGDALFSPLESGTVHFSLATGAIVEALESSGAYAKVRRADGRIGWVKAAMIEKIR